MTSNVPELDDITFDELIEGARGLIPRYAPTWTDHNLHDPGMTLLDLLAWIVDQQIYRVGFISDRLLESFAALLGQRRRPPQPARGLVWPEGRAVAALLPEGTEVTCLSRRALPFELDHELFLTGSVLTGLALGPGRLRPPAQPAGAVGLPLRLDPAGSPDAWLHLRFGSALVPHQMHLPTSRATVPVAVGFDVVPPPTAPAVREGRRPLSFQYRVGGGHWIAVDTEADTTLALTCTGVIVLGIPPAERDAAEPAELRARLDPEAFPVPVEVRDVGLNVLPVRQTRSFTMYQVFAEPPEGSGQPDQLVELDTTGLVGLGGQPALSVSIAGQSWTGTRDLSTSGPDDRHYLCRPDGLQFGNGINGSLPLPSAQIQIGTMHRTLGAQGNVRAGLTWSIPVLPADTVYGRNRARFADGADRTTLDELMAAARAVAVGRSAALSNEDLQRIALELPGLAVARAEVVTGYDSRLPDRRDLTGVRTLVVLPTPPAAPAGAHSAGGAPTPPLAPFVAAVRTGLEPHRVLGERLRVTAPELVGIDVAVTLTVEPGADPTATAQLVKDRIRLRLSATAQAGNEPWPLGRTVTSQDIEEVVVTTPGVAVVSRCLIAPAGALPDSSSVALPRIGVAVAGQIQVDPSTAAETSRRPAP